MEVKKKCQDNILEDKNTFKNNKFFFKSYSDASGNR